MQLAHIFDRPGWHPELVALLVADGPLFQGYEGFVFGNVGVIETKVGDVFVYLVVHVTSGITLVRLYHPREAMLAGEIVARVAPTMDPEAFRRDGEHTRRVAEAIRAFGFVRASGPEHLGLVLTHETRPGERPS
jgi:hypothetical protein